MTEIEKNIDNNARDYLAFSHGPYNDTDMIEAYKAGAEAMSNILRLRSPYNWGVKQTMLNLKKGQKLKLPYDERRIRSFRTVAASFRNLGCLWHIGRNGDDIIITRTL